MQIFLDDFHDIGLVSSREKNGIFEKYSNQSAIPLNFPINWKQKYLSMNKKYFSMDKKYLSMNKKYFSMNKIEITGKFECSKKFCENMRNPKSEN